MSRRTLLQGGFVVGSGLAAATVVGCSESESSNPNIPTSNPQETNASTTQQPTEKTPNKEVLDSSFEIFPFEVSDAFSDSFNRPDEGFRAVTIGMGIRNPLDEDLVLSPEKIDEFKNSLRDATITTAEGFEYPLQESVSIPYSLREPYSILPAKTDLQRLATTLGVASGGNTKFIAYRTTASIEDYYNNSPLIYSKPVIQIFSAVPTNATGLKLNVPGHDQMDLDKAMAENNNANNVSQFEALTPGTEILTANENIKVTITDISKVEHPEDAISYFYDEGDYDIYNFYRLGLQYSNLDQGYAQEGSVNIYYIDQFGNYVLVPYIPTDLEYGDDPYVFKFGPGISRDYVAYMALFKSVDRAAIVFRGKDNRVFNAPIS